MKKDAKTDKQENKEIEELKIKIANFEDKYKRALADYQNLEKRSREHHSELVKLANRDLILRLLPILDTLKMAENHVSDQGLSLSIKQFTDALKNEGAEKIEVTGKKFDPSIMECVEVKEGEEGKVMEEVREGYWYPADGEIIRPTQVKVGKEKVDQKEEELAKEELVKGDYA